MTAGLTTELVSALVAIIENDGAFDPFTLSDRPASEDQLPHIQIGTLAAEPWTTGSSTGWRCSLTIIVVARQDSRAILHDAVDALTSALRDPLPLALGTMVAVPRLDAELSHIAASGLDQAKLTYACLLDGGDLT